MPKLEKTLTAAVVDGLPLPPNGRAHTIYFASAVVPGFAIQVTRSGRRGFLLVYVSPVTGREVRMPLGEFGPAPRLSLNAGIKLAKLRRAEVTLGRDPWLEAKQTVTHAKAEASAAKVRATATLGALLAAYLKRLGTKPSAREIELSIARNLTEPFPGIAALALSEVTVEAVLPAVRRLTRAGKWREAEKFTAYLRAACAAAVAARSDAAAHEFDGLGLLHHPLLALKVNRPVAAVDEQAEEARGSDHLSAIELRHYFRRVLAIADPRERALLVAHLLLGAQRVRQLRRCTQADLKSEGGIDYVLILDPKGKRAMARRHPVPVLPEVRDALTLLHGEGRGPFLFTLNDGARPASHDQLARLIARVGKEMRDAHETRQSVTHATLRRTVETLLAGAGVDDKTRGRLQSHGVHGVQDKSYNRHSYLPEVHTALLTLRKLCETPARPNNITPLRRGVRA